MECNLRGKVALITGASRGIGRGIALELAAAGCHVILTARNLAALERVASEVRDRGGRATVYATDLCPQAAADVLAEKVKQDVGQLDILVNNAGAVKRGSFFTLSERDWQDGFALKFFAHMRLCRALWPLLKKSNGSVVFISGIGARAPVADYMIGAAVIGASLAFMRALSDIGKEDGVQVLAINPGQVDTDRFRHRLDIIMKQTGLNETAAREHHRKELEITRFGVPEDVAALVAFVVSPRGRWLHGTSIDIDGGQWVPVRMSRYDESPRTPAAAE
jgi:3-oxoacyl-[acyl-carrier protein] reductase